jgi:hypothetical protein
VLKDYGLNKYSIPPDPCGLGSIIQSFGLPKNKKPLHVAWSGFLCSISQQDFSMEVYPNWFLQEIETQIQRL